MDAAATNAAIQPPGYYYDSNSKYYWNPRTEEWYYQDSAGNFVQAPSGAGNSDDAGGNTSDQAAQQQPASAEESVSEVAKGHRYLRAILLPFIHVIEMTFCPHACPYTLGLPYADAGHYALLPVAQYCKRNGEMVEANKEAASPERGTGNPKGQVRIMIIGVARAPDNFQNLKRVGRLGSHF